MTYYALTDHEGRRWTYDRTRQEAEARLAAQADPSYYAVEAVAETDIPSNILSFLAQETE